MPLQARHVRFVFDQRTEAIEQDLSIGRLLSKRIEEWPLADFLSIISKAPLPVELHALPAVVDSGPSPIAGGRRPHHDQHPTAVAVEIVAVVLNEGILPNRQVGALGYGDGASLGHRLSRAYLNEGNHCELVTSP